MKIDNKVNVNVQIGSIIASISNWLVSAAFIWLGWYVLAPHLNAPMFGYWEILAMRLALGSILAMFKRKIE